MRPSVLGMWRALWEVDPWGQERGDLQAAVVARAVASGLLKKEGGGYWSLADFMPLAQVNESERQRSLSQRIRGIFHFIGSNRKAKT